MTTQPDDRSPLARAMAWTSHVTTISLEMVVPGVIGLWIDQKLGTGMLFLVLGVLLGLGMGMWHLIKLTSVRPDDTPQRNEEN